MKTSGLVGLTGLIMGTAIIGASLISNVSHKENLGERIQRPAQINQVSDKSYPINLKYESGEDSKEIFRITLELDQKTNTLYLGNYTQDYNRQNWQGSDKEKLPTYARHTRINPFSKTFILHPPEIKISGMEQKIFLVSQNKYGWDQNAKPYEKHAEAQRIIEGGQKIVDWAVGKIPIPYFSDFFNNWIQSSKDKENIDIRETVSKIRNGYTATIIPSYIKNNLLGSVETAREYKIKIDTSQINGDVPLYLLTKIILGDSTNAPSGSFPNKYGELENVVLEFRLKGNKNNIVRDVKQKTTDKKFEMCFYYDGGRRKDGKNPIEEIIFYVRRDSYKWEEFYKSQNINFEEVLRSKKFCADGKIILENRNSDVYVRAVGKYNNGWEKPFACATGERKVSWDDEKEIKLDFCSFIKIN